MEAMELKKGMIFKMFGELYVIENGKGDLIEYRNLNSDKLSMIANSEANRKELAAHWFKISDAELCEMFDHLDAEGWVIEKDGIAIRDPHMDEMGVYSVPARYYAAEILKAWGRSHYGADA